MAEGLTVIAAGLLVVLCIMASMFVLIEVILKIDQVMKDRATAETDFKVNLKNEVNIESILRELGEFRAEANQRLEGLEKKTTEKTTVEKRAGVQASQPPAV